MATPLKRTKPTPKNIVRSALVVYFKDSRLVLRSSLASELTCEIRLRLRWYQDLDIHVSIFWTISLFPDLSKDEVSIVRVAAGPSLRFTTLIAELMAFFLVSFKVGQ